MINEGTINDQNEWQTKQERLRKGHPSQVVKPARLNQSILKWLPTDWQLKISIAKKKTNLIFDPIFTILWNSLMVQQHNFDAENPGAK
jgi:hypothetical protein